jgi:anti-repressor protein
MVVSDIIPILYQGLYHILVQGALNVENFLNHKEGCVMNELIKIQQHNDQNLVDARELHAFLESGRDFSNWIKDRISKYSFIENQDYVSFAKIVERVTGATTRIEYGLTIDMAKELSMVEGNAKGKQARRYFIEIEKRYQSIISIDSISRKDLAKMLFESEEAKKEHNRKSICYRKGRLDRVLHCEER